MAWDFNDGNTDINTSADAIGGAIAGGNDNQGIYQVSTTQNYPLGHKREFEDGRIFRYAYFSTACGPGKLCAQDVSLTNVASIDGKFVDSAGAAKDDYAAGDTAKRS